MSQTRTLVIPTWPIASTRRLTSSDLNRMFQTHKVIPAKLTGSKRKPILVTFRREPMDTRNGKGELVIGRNGDILQTVWCNTDLILHENMIVAQPWADKGLEFEAAGDRDNAHRCFSTYLDEIIVRLEFWADAPNAADFVRNTEIEGVLDFVPSEKLPGSYRTNIRNPKVTEAAVLETIKGINPFAKKAAQPATPGANPATPGTPDTLAENAGIAVGTGNPADEFQQTLTS